MEKTFSFSLVSDVHRKKLLVLVLVIDVDGKKI